MKKLVFGFVVMLMFSQVSFGQTSPANSKNSYDNVGRLHNIILEEFLSKFAGKGLTVEQICSETEKIANNNQEFLSLKDENYKPIDVAMIKNASGDFKNNFKTVIDNSKLSAEGKLRAQELIDYIFSVGFNTQYTRYSDFYNYVVNYENKIMSNSKLTAEDKAAILSGSSTARYSIYFWDKRFGGSNQAGLTAKRGFWGSVIVGTCDVVGVVVGYLEGGIDTAISTGTSASNLAGQVIDEK